jgi:hypothetical protein
MSVEKKNCTGEFLDDGQYSRNGILRYERIFGDTFVSTGGVETTKVKYSLSINQLCNVLESFKSALDLITSKSLYIQFSLSLKSAEVKVHFSKNGRFVRPEEY